MEAVVAAVAARLRARAGSTRVDGQETEQHDWIPRKSTRVFASLPARKRSSTNGQTEGHVDWPTLVRTIFRRYAGELLVEGKLLNLEEIEVHRFARMHESSTTIVSLVDSSVGKFIMRIREAPTTAISSIITALVVKPHARVLSDTVAMSLPIALYQSETFCALCRTTNQECIVDMKTVMGFDVRHFPAVSNQRRRDGKRYDTDDDNDDVCANAVIMKHPTFSDLRGVHRLMEASNLSPMHWPTLLTTALGDSMSEESDWSFVSLGAAQKKRWARDRTVRGNALRTKGRWKECLVEYDSALRLDDKYGEALLRRGQVYVDIHQYDDAIRDFELLCQLEPTNEAAIQGLLRAKGKLNHSKHVASASFHRLSVSASRETRGPFPRHQDSNRTEDCHDKPTDTKNEEVLAALEQDRLRQLLEKDVKSRKRHKTSRRRCPRDSSSSDESSDSRHKRKKRSKHKKSKKSRSSSRDHKRQKKSSRRSDSDSSDSSGSRHRHCRSKRSRRSRSRSPQESHRSRSETQSNGSTVKRSEMEDERHPVLMRKPHRLWN